MKWRQFIEDYWELVKKNELMALGGQVSYYLLLSLFPLLIFFFTIAGFADLSSEKIFSELKYLIPVEALQIVENIVYEIFSAQSNPSVFWYARNSLGFHERNQSLAARYEKGIRYT